MTRIEEETLECYWDAAAARVPLIIFGAGRWGRLWSEVATRARGSAKGIVLIARTNFAETKRWQAEEFDERAALLVAPTFEDANKVLEGHGGLENAISIVANRPVDHLFAAQQAISAGLPTLVEKPLSDDPAAALAFLDKAMRCGKLVGLGVEFALLPAAHFIARLIAERGAAVTDITLVWNDPMKEVRHGDRKREHHEVNLLADLLPHAASLGRIFAPGTWSLEEARISTDEKSGLLKIRCGGVFLEFRCNKAAAKRVRNLTLSDKRKTIAQLDFSGDPAVTMDGKAMPLPPRVAHLDSTLRLELGAFLSDVKGQSRSSPITKDIESYTHLQSALHREQIVCQTVL